MNAARSRPLGTRTLAALSVLALAAFAGLVSLGVWQLQRLHWKRALIERVEQHLAAAPVPAPSPAQWSAIGESDAYLRVSLHGDFHHELETCTQAVTELGAGCWVMTPLRTGEGWWVWVNRGFVDDAHRDPSTRLAGQVGGAVSVQGLLRLSEPHGGFLRRNDPAAGRWHSRDVAALAQARGLPAAQVAPYFIDAADSIEGGPAAGLTVVHFRNAHLPYALTWFALALMVLGLAALVARRELRLRAG